MEKVCVVIPTYQRPERLCTAIGSALNQTRAPDRVLVADNDPDGSAKITVQDFAASEIPVEHKAASTVKGPSHARNSGARSCSSDWLAFLDDDDEWDSAYLETVMSVADATGADAVFTGISMRRYGQEKQVKRLPLNMTLDDVVRHGNPGVTGSNIVIRSQAFDRLSGFDEEFVASEDIDLLMRIVLNGLDYAVNERAQVFHIIHDDGHLSDFGNGAIADGGKLLLQRHGRLLSWRARNNLLAKMHYASFSSAITLKRKLYHATLSTIRGDKRALREIIFER